MTPDDLDRMLSTEDDIVPTSGFAPSVMERVRREASAAPPIPFPWKRFAAGILALLLVAVALASSGVTEPLLARIAGLSYADWSRGGAWAVDAAARTGVAWVAGALLVAFASLRLSLGSAWR